MKRGLLSCALMILLPGLVMTGGCTMLRSPVVPYVGSGFNSTTFPVDIAFDQTEIGTRAGRSSAQTILGLISWGDASVAAAARNGGIKQIDHIDAKLFNILVIYVQYETVVYGRSEEEMQKSAASTALPATPETHSGG